MGKYRVLDTVRVELGERAYDIEIGEGLLTALGVKAKAAGLTGRLAVVTNDTVGPLYARVALDSLRDAGYSAELIEIPDGEEYKSLQWASHLYDRLLTMRFDRKCALVALGGGVVGDLTGFVAATYMRGIPFIQAPTTLLSQVDSSVGGKTGVNHPLGKNMIGAFYQPVYVCADVSTFATLPQEEFLSGMAEVVKYGVIYDPEFFAFIEGEKDAILAKEPGALAHVIRRSCEIKAAVVALDERESGLRAILNYGHTVGHAVEALTNYTGYRHGEAVSLGMVAAARLANKSGLCKKDVPARVEALLSALGLPVKFPELDPDSVIDALSLDKKAEDGKVKMVLPTKIGEVVITPDWDVDALKESLKK
ncbi:MAG TPA: 3-dehydroquinate synthase [Nitrospirota bacterium]